MDDLRWLDVACDLARRCPPSSTAFSVGAVIVGPDGHELSRGFSRETDPHAHAEEAALHKIAGAWLRAPGTTLYSSLEPCARRRSRPRSCAELILAAGVPRVVYAWQEPSIFVEGGGADLLAAGGVQVVWLDELADRAREPNAHLLDR